MARSPKATQRTKPPVRRSYRNLDLKPKALPRVARAEPGKGKGKGKGKGGTKGAGKQAWAGSDSFGRKMRAYHQRWKEWHRDYSGLTDAFFGDAQVALDRCLETRITHKLRKHLTYAQIAKPTLGPKWRGRFLLSWDQKGNSQIRLHKSWGYHSLDKVMARWAKGCLGRITVPKRLKGKRLQMVARTKVFAKIRANLSSLIGFTEVRDPQTGGMRWKFAPIGSIAVWSNTLFLRQRILP